jgi:hypothetical protein
VLRLHIRDMDVKMYVCMLLVLVLCRDAWLVQYFIFEERRTPSQDILNRKLGGPAVVAERRVCWELNLGQKETGMETN